MMVICWSWSGIVIMMVICWSIIVAHGLVVSLAARADMGDDVGAVLIMVFADPVGIVAEVAGLPLLYPDHGDVHTVSGVHGAAHSFVVTGVRVVGVKVVTVFTLGDGGVHATGEAVLIVSVHGLDLGGEVVPDVTASVALFFVLIFSNLAFIIPS